MKVTCRVCSQTIKSTDEEVLIKAMQAHANTHRFYLLSKLQQEHINRMLAAITFDGPSDFTELKQEVLFPRADLKENFE